MLDDYQKWENDYGVLHWQIKPERSKIEKN